MPALLTKDEASNLFSYINHSKNPRKNMHTRDVERPSIKGQRKWNYLNGMKCTKNVTTHTPLKRFPCKSHLYSN